MNFQAQNPTYEKIYGDKYEGGLDTAEIAKRIRKDIKAAVKAGTLPNCKCSVRISRFSGGSSINCTIKEVDLQVLNPEFVRREMAGENGYTLYHTVGKYTPEATAFKKDLEDIVDAYNFDGSDTMTDYFHVNYYSTVEFGWKNEREWEKALKEQIAAENAAELVERAHEVAEEMFGAEEPTPEPEPEVAPQVAFLAWLGVEDEPAEPDPKPLVGNY